MPWMWCCFVYYFHVVCLSGVLLSTRQNNAQRLPERHQEEQRVCFLADQQFFCGIESTSNWSIDVDVDAKNCREVGAANFRSCKNYGHTCSKHNSKWFLNWWSSKFKFASWRTSILKIFQEWKIKKNSDSKKKYTLPDSRQKRFS